jgi:hypothetical protein
MLRAELIRRTMEMSGEVLGGADVATDGGRSVVATLQFLIYGRSFLGHREFLLCNTN